MLYMLILVCLTSWVFLLNTQQSFFPDRFLSAVPRWLSGKEFTCQGKRWGFDPWVGKIRWRRKWQPTPVFSPGEFNGQRSLVGYIVHGGSQKGWTRLRDYVTTTRYEGRQEWGVAYELFAGGGVMKMFQNQTVAMAAQSCEYNENW